ncbi:HAD-IIIC family phosphatase [Streptomyces sp. NPDC002851]
MRTTVDMCVGRGGPYPATPVKCLVWDLDETLRQGTLLEGDDVVVTDEVRRVVLALDARGVLQSVVSRNDHDLAWDRLVREGIAEYIVLPQIGWGPKSAAVRRIAERLGFAVDTVALIDDQPAERAEVQLRLPQVRCYAAQDAVRLTGLAEFRAARTPDARRRRASYQANFRRQQAREAFAGPDEDFIRSLGVTMRIDRAAEADLDRLEELTRRTSQMNATGVPYSDAELRVLLQDPEHEVLAISMEDRFGQHGAVGIVLLERRRSVWRLKLLATSCRGVSFGAGAVALRWLIDQAARGAVHLAADFRPTERNRTMEVAYRFAGFGAQPCACLDQLGRSVDRLGTELLHVVPERGSPPDTMRLIAPDLYDPPERAPDASSLMLYGWFARSVARFPDEPAVECGSTRLTYRELRSRVLEAARRIVRAHRGTPATVALLADRGIAGLTGYLAAQRLGATLVPLSPGFPVQRNRLICEMAEPDVLVVTAPGGARYPGALDEVCATALTLDETAEPPEAAGPHPPKDALPPNSATPDDVTYILFTSGSTGRPKGVPIRHRHLATYLAHSIARYELGPGCRMSHTFDLTFDPSVFDLFAALGSGATVVVAGRDDLLTPVEYLREKRITHWFSVPSVISVAEQLSHLPAGRVSTLRHSVFIGEQLTYDQAHAWRRAAPGATIENVYGPTELTVACTSYTLPPRPDQWPATSNCTVPIGPVHAHLDHLILDEHGRPAAEGELCVRGPQRFDGYLDPADNHGRFLRHEGNGGAVYGGTEGLTSAHYYRTGDLVRREAGILVHHGRLDHQVKIHG